MSWSHPMTRLSTVVSKGRKIYAPRPGIRLLIGHAPFLKIDSVRLDFSCLAADIFLWRTRKCLLGFLEVLRLYGFFSKCLNTISSPLFATLILALALLFLWSNASTLIKAPPRIPKVSLQEKCVVEIASALRFEANRGLAILKEIASGRELKKFLVDCGLSVVGSWFSVVTLFYITFILLFAVLVFYEKYEDQVDAFAEKAMNELKRQYAVLDEKVLSNIPGRPLKEKKMD